MLPPCCPCVHRVHVCVCVCMRGRVSHSYRLRSTSSAPRCVAGPAVPRASHTTAATEQQSESASEWACVPMPNISTDRQLKWNGQHLSYVRAVTHGASPSLPSSSNQQQQHTKPKKNYIEKLYQSSESVKETGMDKLQRDVVCQFLGRLPFVACQLTMSTSAPCTAHTATATAYRAYIYYSQQQRNVETQSVAISLIERRVRPCVCGCVSMCVRVCVLEEGRCWPRWRSYERREMDSSGDAMKPFRLFSSCTYRGAASRFDLCFGVSRLTDKSNYSPTWRLSNSVCIYE